MIDRIHRPTAPTLKLDGARLAVVACATVVEEILPHLPATISAHTLDFGLHVNPENLKRALQEAIDDLAPDVDIILLGYGLCSMAVVGLHTEHCTLVVPKVDDCISIFLGSGQAYEAQARREPGTYYLTKGWIEAGDGPFADYDRLVDRYGEEKARWVTDQILKNYTRLALINTGQTGMDQYRDYSRCTAARFGLRYEEIPGSDSLIKKLLHGPWDDEFAVAPPGHIITYLDFKDI